MNRLSIIIPSYNSGATIERTLAGIESQTKRSAICEVIVVDSSDDGVTQRSLSHHLSNGIRVITSGDPRDPRTRSEYRRKRGYRGYSGVHGCGRRPGS